MANDRLINSTQGDSIITELRAMNTNLADIKSAMSGEVKVISEKDVNFYDYDGSRLASYTAAEFADLTALPDNPTHTGLTAQGWNWSLADAKSYIADYGKLNIGQMYITSDGKTRLYIRLGEGRLKPYLGLTGNSNGTAVSIDWGDNSAEESVTLNANTVYTPHEYATGGDYVIAVTVTTGSISFVGNSSNHSNIFRKSTTAYGNADRVYQNILIKLEIGSSVTSMGNNAFFYCTSLTSITIPNSITSIGDSAFYCTLLTSITIPNSITSLGSDTFNSCSSLTSITIPNSITSLGSNTFYNSPSLTSVAIPNNITSIGGYAFSYCTSLTSVTIPNGVTSIGNSMFYNSPSLTSITIPNSITSLGSNTFNSCYGLGFIKFSSSTPPTASSGTFDNIRTDCIIYVPTGSLSAYTSASNYPSSSTYTYVEY